MGSLIETLVGATVAAAARVLGAIQAATGLQAKARPLTDAEAETLRRVYRGALDLAPIRIVDGRSGLFGLSGRPFTLGNCIYLKGFDSSRSMEVLVHEACHVRQYQHDGTRYVGGSLLAQLTRGAKAYDWRAERSAGKNWRSFGPEAQAQLIQDLFGQGRRGSARGSGAFFGDEPLGEDVSFVDADLTAFARESVEDARRPAS